MRHHVRGWGLLLVLAAATPTVADDDPSPTGVRNLERAAQAVLDAIDSGEDAALATLAAQDDPDPWLVAEALRLGGHVLAARRHATIAPRPRTQGLPAYLDTLAASAGSPVARGRLVLLEQALSASDWPAVMREKAPPSGNGTVLSAYARFCQGRALLASRRLDDAQQALEDAGERAALLGWQALAARVRRFQGNVAFRRGRLPEAVRIWRESAEAARAVGDLRDAGQALRNVGLAYVRLGRIAEALESQKEALAALDQVADPIPAATARLSLAAVYGRRGAYGKTLDLCERVLVAAKASGDEALAARALGNMGNVHYRIGSFADAAAAYERALAIFEARDDIRGQGATLANLASARQRQGDFKGALEGYDSALRVFERLGDGRARALAELNRGITLASAGRWSEALAQYERARTAFVAAEDHAGIGETALHIADALRLSEEPERSRAAYAESLNAQHVTQDTDLQARILTGLAQLEFQAGRFDAAGNHARDAVHAIAGLVGRLSDLQSARSRSVWADLYDVGVRAALAHPDPDTRRDGVAFFLESGRAGALLEGLEARRSLHADWVPEALRIQEQAARTAERGAHAAYADAVRIGNRKAIRQARRQLDEASAESAEVLQRIQRSVRGSALLYPRAASLDSIRARLGPGDALVLYGLAPAGALALVVRPAGARVVPLGDAQPVLEACDLLLPEAPPHVDPSAVAGLAALVATPLELGDDVRRVLVSPAGRLGYVPFSLLFPDREVVLVPSGSALDTAPRRSGRGSGVLGLGDPLYGERAPAWSLPRKPLPATRGEVEAVATHRLLGADATESRLRELLATRPHWRAVHVACHGTLDPARPLLSSLAVTADALDDGSVTVMEVFRMTVPADLVVLSACQSGRGAVYRAEGIVGLTRAFMHAGAPRVLCSLWNVNDRATRALMIRFYALWNPEDPARGLRATEALRQAQAHVRSQAKWAHPRYWAAWVLWSIER